MTPSDTRSVVIERHLPFPPEKIWRALTDGTLMKQWLMDNDFQPVADHDFSFRTAPMPKWDGVINSKVLVIEPSKRLSYRWDALGLESVVVWTLVATGNGTLLRMEQSGFRPDQKAAYQGASYGWQSFIAKLEQLIPTLN